MKLLDGSVSFQSLLWDMTQPEMKDHNKSMKVPVFSYLVSRVISVEKPIRMQTVYNNATQSYGYRGWEELIKPYRGFKRFIIVKKGGNVSNVQTFFTLSVEGLPAHEAAQDTLDTYIQNMIYLHQR